MTPEYRVEYHHTNGIEHLVVFKKVKDTWQEVGTFIEKHLIAVVKQLESK